MKSGGEGQISQATYRDMARRVIDTTIEEFEVTPSRKIHSEALAAAMKELQKSKSVDSTAMRAALEAARSVFIKAGFNQKAFVTKFGADRGETRFRRFSTDAAEFTREVAKKGDEIVLVAKRLMAKPPHQAGPELADIIKRHLS